MNAREGIKTLEALRDFADAHGLLKTMNAREGIKTAIPHFFALSSAFVKNNECP